LDTPSYIVKKMHGILSGRDKVAVDIFQNSRHGVAQQLRG